jgi:hypothetical protein
MSIRYNLTNWKPKIRKWDNRIICCTSKLFLFFQIWTFRRTLIIIALKWIICLLYPVPLLFASGLQYDEAREDSLQCPALINVTFVQGNTTEDIGPLYIRYCDTSNITLNFYYMSTGTVCAFVTAIVFILYGWTFVKLGKVLHYLNY